MMKTLNQNKKGFTLVELLVVIAIIAILSVTAFVALGGQTGKARDSQRQNNVGSVQTALSLYFLDHSTYPNDLNTLVTEGKIASVPVDPTTEEPYVYAVSPSKKQFQIGATLEGEDGTYEAYVIGNVAQGDPGLLPGVNVPETAGCNGLAPVNGSTDCVPMDIWTP